MDDSVKKYLSEIGRKGGKKSKRMWTLQQKEKMIKKLVKTLRREKEGNNV